MKKEQTFKVHSTPELHDSSLVVGWTEDAGKLGARVISYLNRKLGCTEFAEIEPNDFFPLSGVIVEDDVARFPDSRFYCSLEKNLVTFHSTPPMTDWYRFLNALLDVAEYYCHVRELYVIGSMVSLSAHTAPRDLFTIANGEAIKEAIAPYTLGIGMDFETPPGQRPTLSSFLLWAARRRNIPAVSLWVPVPFYLVTSEDPRAWKRGLEFMNQRLNLGLDLEDVDGEVARQDEKIDEIRASTPKIDDCFRKLESHAALTEEENETLVKEVEARLKKRR